VEEVDNTGEGGGSGVVKGVDNTVEGGSGRGVVKGVDGGERKSCNFRVMASASCVGVIRV
jgi:hypothetical protein